MAVKRLDSLQLIGAMLLLSITTLAGADTDGEAVTIARRYQIHSKILNEQRPYIVHKPRDYDLSQDRYPVLILLDGDGHIHNVSASVDFLAEHGRILPMIVVGIPNTNRQRDLTPPVTNKDWEHTPGGEVGGAPQFLSFIADELIPHLDRTYRTHPTRILVGHSYGGLFALHALFTRPEVFKGYIAVSPSLWWDNQSLVAQAEKFVTGRKGSRSYLYMTVGNEDGTMLGGIHRVIGTFAWDPVVVVAELHRWPEETHGSVPMRSVYEGLEWLFQSYYIHEPERMYEESGLDAFEKRFALFSKEAGFEVKVPEGVLMQVHNWLTHGDRSEEARVVLEKVLQLYPGHPYAHFDLGNYYAKANDKVRALEHFTKSLELYPSNAAARTELQKLGVDPKTIVPEAKPSLRTLRGYVGEYRVGDDVGTVTLDDGKLRLTTAPGTCELLARSDSDFYCDNADLDLTFHKRRNGKPTSVTVHTMNSSYERVKVK